jgi:hypothetical protein
MVPGGVSIRRLTDDRIRHGGDDGYGKDADRKTGGPRYLLLARVAALKPTGWERVKNPRLSS